MASRSWENWARTQRVTPRRVERPVDAGGVADAIRRAVSEGLTVRAVGSGHSFTGAAVADGVQLDLAGMCTLEGVVQQPDGRTFVTVGAGIRLADLSALLAARGLAMENMGDIDHQTLAGAISTGTHGTGAHLRGMAAQVVGVQLVTAAGEIVELGPCDEAFELARLGLGSAGVLAAVTMAAVPAFRLEAREEPLPLDDVLDGLDGLVETNDHFEFYWFCHTRQALTKRNNRVPDEVRRPLSAVRGWLDDELLSNGVFEVVNRVATAAPRAVRALNALSAHALGARTYTASSHDVFVSPRRVRFREMEYAVPRATVRGVLEEIDRWTRTHDAEVPFPVEVRFAAADDLWLSTATGRDTAYVAVHQYWRMPYEAYFAAVERIVAQVDGRPHWGKLHTLDADRLFDLYPRMGDVRRVRAALDPAALFSNAYVDRVLGPVAP
ncbi:MAG TPA: D-arabinono-1,4-lactone oxidase [Cellulomonas sp.]